MQYGLSPNVIISPNYTRSNPSRAVSIVILLGVPNGILHTKAKVHSEQIVTRDYYAAIRETEELGGLRG
jgi:hypothetical protein